MSQPAIEITLPDEDVPPTATPVQMAKVIELPAPAQAAPEELLDEPPATYIHVHTIEQCSPLYQHYGPPARWTPGARWHGQLVTDPEEIAAIHARVHAEPTSRWARFESWLRR